MTMQALQPKDRRLPSPGRKLRFAIAAALLGLSALVSTACESPGGG